jgi:hypothetical protein
LIHQLRKGLDIGRDRSVLTNVKELAKKCVMLIMIKTVVEKVIEGIPSKIWKFWSQGLIPT